MVALASLRGVLRRNAYTDRVCQLRRANDRFGSSTINAKNLRKRVARYSVVRSILNTRKRSTRTHSTLIDCRNLHRACVCRHLAWMQCDRKEGGIGRIRFPLLSDVKHKMSSDYGVMMDEGHTSRATIIISDKGIIRHISLNDPPVRDMRVASSHVTLCCAVLRLTDCERNKRSVVVSQKSYV